MESESDLYTVLGLKKKATQGEIKKAYFRLAKIHHPDKGGNPANFRKIFEAYETLYNEESRKAYDLNQQTYSSVDDDKYQAHLEMFRDLFKIFGKEVARYLSDPMNALLCLGLGLLGGGMTGSPSGALLGGMPLMIPLANSVQRLPVEQRQMALDFFMQAIEDLSEHNKHEHEQKNKN